MYSASARLVRIAALVLAAVAARSGAVEAQSWRTVTSARQLWGTEPVKVRIEYGSGRLEVRQAEKGMMYRMETRYDQEHFASVSTFSQESRTLTLGVRAKDGKGGM